MSLRLRASRHRSTQLPLSLLAISSGAALPTQPPVCPSVFRLSVAVLCCSADRLLSAALTASLHPAMSASACQLRSRLLSYCRLFQLHPRCIGTSSTRLQQVAQPVASAKQPSAHQPRLPPRTPRFPPRPASRPAASSPSYARSTPPAVHSSRQAASQAASSAAPVDGESIESDGRLSPWDILKLAVIVAPQPSPPPVPSSPATTAATTADNAAPPRYTFTPPSPPRPELFISTPQQLRALTSLLAECPVVAIDTEFLTFPTYRPALHVFQISSSSVLAAIDCQTLADRSEFHSFLSMLLSREQVVLHSAQGDMVILHDLCAKHGLLPQLSRIRMFDTQMAAAYCGYGDMIGYGKLLADLYGVHVSKSDQMTDWSKRPLSPQQLQYAINDVRYLHAVYDDLSRELREKERWEWAAEEMAAIPNQTLYAPIDPREAWRLVWGAKKLDEHSDELSVLRELCEWRESTARARNQLVILLVRDDALVAAAQQMPSSAQQLEGVQGLKPAIIARYSRRLLDAVRRGRYEVVGAARDELYHRVPHKQAMRLKDGLFNLLTSRAAAVAQSSGISLYQIAPRNELLDLASVSAEAIERVKRSGQEGGVRNEDMRPVRMISNYYGVKHEQLPYELSTAPQSLYGRRKEPVEGEASVAGLARTLTVDEEVEMLCKLKVLSGWRRQLVGNDLLEIACGESLAWDSDRQTATLEAEQTQQQRQQQIASELQSAVDNETAARKRADERMAALRVADADAQQLMAAWLDKLDEWDRVAVYKTVGAIVQRMDGAAKREQTTDGDAGRLLDAHIVSEVRELVARTLALQAAADNTAGRTTRGRKKKDAAVTVAERDGTAEAVEGEAAVIDKPRVRRTRKKPPVTEDVTPAETAAVDAASALAAK